MKHILFVVLALCVAASAYGQNGITALHYNVSVPTQDFTDFISKTSWLGVGFDGRWFVSPDRPLSVGIALGWQVFDEHTSGTTQLPHGALTGEQGRFINSFPMMVTGHYYFGNQEKIWAFIGGGVGTYYIQERFEAGVLAWEDGDWHFGAYPELGFQVPIQEADLFVSGRYNFAFKAGESLSGEGKEFDYVSFQVGLAWDKW